MPPKKKDDEQLKKLEQQRKRKQQQQARQQLQRKKYLPETLPTGLFIPTSPQLLLDFPHKTVQFITEKLKEALKDAYPELCKSSRFDFVVRQLHYFIKDSYQLFGEVKEGVDGFRHRVFVGVMFAVLVNGDGQGKGVGKNKAEDQRKIKQLVTVHCNKIEGFNHLSKDDGLAILKYAKKTYFDRFLLIQTFNKFPKRQTETVTPIYIQTPNYYYNDHSTPFTDLSKPEQPQPKQ